jgi:hypothetical protein
MIEKELRRPFRLLAILLCGVVISCTKDANLVITTPPEIDTTAVVKYMGSFANGPYGRVSGRAEVLKQDTNYILSLKSFSSSSGPDLHVYLSKEVQPVHFLDLGSLRSRTDDQAYSIPNGVDFRVYKYALIHCQAYNHLFGSAILQ